MPCRPLLLCRALGGLLAVKKEQAADHGALAFPPHAKRARDAPQACDSLQAAPRAWPDNAPRLRQVVDDSEMDRMVSEAFVEELGFDVVCAGSGEECVQVRSACATLLMCAVAAPCESCPAAPSARASARAARERDAAATTQILSDMMNQNPLSRAPPARLPARPSGIDPAWID